MAHYDIQIVTSPESAERFVTVHPPVPDSEREMVADITSHQDAIVLKGIGESELPEVGAVMHVAYSVDRLPGPAADTQVTHVARRLTSLLRQRRNNVRLSRQIRHVEELEVDLPIGPRLEY